MSPQKEIIKGASSKNRNTKTRKVSLKRRGTEIAEKSTRGAASKSLSYEDIMASLIQLEEEMAERKPQRGSSMSKILKTRWAALKHLERGRADLRGRIRSEDENQKKMLKALEKEEEDIARKRAMNEEEKEEIRVLDEWLNNPLLAAVVLGDRIEDHSGEAAYSDQSMIWGEEAKGGFYGVVTDDLVLYCPKQTRKVSLKRRGTEIAEKSTRGPKGLSCEEIMASLSQLEEEMAERKPRRGSSLEKRLAALERAVADLRERTRSEAEHVNGLLKALEEEEKDIGLKK